MRQSEVLPFTSYFLRFLADCTSRCVRVGGRGLHVFTAQAPVDRASTSSSRQFKWCEEQFMRPYEPECGEGFFGLQLR
jgi:hypothetical protein